MHERDRSSANARIAAAALAVAASLASSGASAHFKLDAPPNWESQDSLGSPQKLGPCGDESGGTPTGIVTAFQQGQTITVTIEEMIFHPGHYRIALAVHDRSELPPEPAVTAGSTPCGTAEIQSPPVFHVLADGVLAHTTAFSGPQSIQVQLPPDVTCDHCTLQVIEFMSEHPLNNPGGCFYHHCADIAIQSVTVGGGGAGGASGAGGTAGSGGELGSAGSAGSDHGGASGAGGSSGGGANGAAAGTEGSSGEAGSPAAATPSASDANGSSDGGCAYGAHRPRSFASMLIGLVALVAWRRRARS